MREGTLGALLSGGSPSFSFELFPPKTDDGEQALWETVRALEALHPTFVSVTYGAGGSTQDRTLRITGQIARESDLLPVGHLTCVGAGRDHLSDVIREYAAEGVNTILALRGDPQFSAEMTQALAKTSTDAATVGSAKARMRTPEVGCVGARTYIRTQFVQARFAPREAEFCYSASI
jgi:5,10-methylenetetrahydrofolate reductase